MRAAGFKPNETFETPNVVCTSGYLALSSAIAFRVSMPSLRVSSCPVAIGNVRVSMRISEVFIPQFFVRSSIRRVATLSFHVQSLA